MKDRANVDVTWLPYFRGSGFASCRRIILLLSLVISTLSSRSGPRQREREAQEGVVHSKVWSRSSGTDDREAGEFFCRGRHQVQS
jgi:hypothetical protein